MWPSMRCCTSSSSSSVLALFLSSPGVESGCGLKRGSVAKYGMSNLPLFSRHHHTRQIYSTGRLTAASHRPSHRALLQTLQNISNLCVLVVLVTAVELTIQFNQIPSSTVNDLTTSSQLIPLFISAGIVVRVIFKWFLNRRINATASSPEYDGDPGVYYYEDGTYDPHGPQPPPPAHMA